MKKEELIKKLGSILRVKESEETVAFKIFTRKLRDVLGPNDAIKIPEFGIFQLKKEPKPRAERGTEFEASGTEGLSLVFSPPLDDLSSSSKALFQVIELNDSEAATEIFDEKVFSLGYNKPLIPIGINASRSAGETMIDEKTVEDKIEDLIAKSELLKNFDIWTDYLGGKEKITGSTESAEEPKESPLGIDAESMVQDLNVDEVEAKEEEPDSGKKEEPEEIEWDWSDELNEALSEKESEKNEEIIVDEADPFSQLEKEIEKEPDTEEKAETGKPEYQPLFTEGESRRFDTEIPKEEKEESSGEEEKSEKESEEKIEKTAGPESQFTLAEPEEIQSVTEPEKKGIGRYIFWAVVIVLIIVIYFFYVRGDEKIETPSERDTSESVTAGGEILKPVPLDNSQKAEKTGNEQTNKVIESSEATKKPEKTPQKTRTQNSYVRNTSGETKVGNLIFYDGKTYSVQIASFKSRTTAEKEAQKWIDKGYDAFVVEAYIAKYGSNWYRLRIGGFGTKEEAQRIKIK